MERRWSQLTMADVQALGDSASPEKYAMGGPFSSGPYKPKDSDALTGKTVDMTFGDYSLSCRFESTNTVVWSENGGAEHTEFCQVHEAPGYDDVFLIVFYCAGSKPPRAMNLVLDLGTGLVTQCDAHLGVPGAAIEVGREFRFGRVAGAGEDIPLHGFTTELVGKAVTWHYGGGAPDVRHIYTMPLYYTYIMIRGDQCWTASNPADYIKIRDDLYVFSFVEERQAGLQSLFLINMKEIHDVGAFFGVSVKGISCKTLGAVGELAEPYEVFEV